jgi:hypothetical protein
MIASQENPSREAVLPLIQLVEWTDANRDLSEELFAPEWLAQFGAALQSKINEVLPETEA